MSRLCKKCNKPFGYYVEYNGVKLELGSRRHCLECVPPGSRLKETIGRKKENAGKRICKSCGKQFEQAGRNLHCSGCRSDVRRNRNKRKAVEIKGGKCIVCGYNRCIRSLDFHHIDSSNKDSNVSRLLLYSWEKVKNELEKCVLLCSNCHGELHAGLISIDKVK